MELVIHNTRRTLRAVAVALVATVALGLLATPARADRVDDLAATLDKDRDEKARIRAAVGLGNLRDPRGVPALIRALDDKSGVVRGLAAQALGHIGDPRAIEALEDVLSEDSNDGVKTRARDALKAIREKKVAATTTTSTSSTKSSVTIKPSSGGASGKAKVYVVVKNMAQKGAGGATPDKDIAKRMRETVVAELGRSADLTLDATAGAKLRQLVVDGSVSKMVRGTNGPWIEVTCEVKLTVSSAEGRLMSIVSGSATVQMPRGSFKSSMEKNMQIEAVENAVRGAHQNLHTYLTKQGK